jgi:SAM-dependent methyltransferase
VPTYREELEHIRRTTGYPDKWTRRLGCPCCGLDSGWAFAFAHDGYDHRRCDACNFSGLDPLPPDDILSDLYEGPLYTALRTHFEASLAKADRRSPWTAPLPMLQSILQTCASGPEGRWLDVGGGIGGNAAYVKAERPGWSVKLNEFSGLCIELARSLYGIEATDLDVDALLARGEAFDAISMIAVLEHINDPFAFVRSYARLLTPSGIMAILVPRFSRLNAAISKGESPAVTPPFHVNLFHENDLARLIERAGLRVIKIEQGNDKAFSLLHHFPTSSYWDTTVPTAEAPTPQAFKKTDYSLELQVKLNALDAADKALASDFVQTDGASLMTVFARLPVE